MGVCLRLYYPLSEEELLAQPNDTWMPLEVGSSAVEVRLSPGVGENRVAGRAERWPRWSLGLGGDDWRRSDPGAGGFGYYFALFSR